MLKNDRFLKALHREPVDRTPVWMMRQAGRYLPEYRAVRSKAETFLNMCQTPEWAAEVTLQPITRYPLDAAIIFSDILILPMAMGCELTFVQGEGPVFPKPIRTQADIDALRPLTPEQDCPYTQAAIEMVVRDLNGRVPLIGFAGSPWTVATYMVEGGGSKTFSIIKRMLYAQPQQLHSLLQKLCDATVASLTAQVKAGASAVMLFDTWGGVLTPQAYESFSLAYMRQIIQALKTQPETAACPIILFTKQGGLWLEQMAESGCDALGCDWTLDIGQARARVGHKVALQGNLDPCVLYADPQTIRAHVKQILAQFGPHPGHIFNLGHGIYPDISPESVTVMLDALHS